MIWSFFVLQEIFLRVTIFAAEEDSRSAYLITRENKQLLGHVVKRFESRGLMLCRQSCLGNHWCSSTNFKESSKKNDKGICELNKEIAPTIEDNKLIDQKGVTFSAFLKGCLLTGCLNGGSCLFDEKKETFTCLCKQQWSGDRCELKTIRHTNYVFTTLGTRGETGPSNTSGYVGTPLEGLVALNNGIQIWTVPVTGGYVIDATGASGANGSIQSLSPPTKWRLGGLGAKIRGTFQLVRGTQLKILVGQEGTCTTLFPVRPGGGGGGSFVTLSDNTPLIVAGGGGGGGTAKEQFTDGDPGQATRNGTQCGGTGGTGGQVCNADTGNIDSDLMSGGGAGLWNDGGGYNGIVTEVALSFIRGGTGGKCPGDNGGFGGGGFAMVLGGGGGGYSGGGVVATDKKGTAGGGGHIIMVQISRIWRVLIKAMVKS